MAAPNFESGKALALAQGDASAKLNRLSSNTPTFKGIYLFQ